MTYREAIAAGLLVEDTEFAWELKRMALARFTSAELLRELKERANRKIVEINARLKSGKGNLRMPKP